MQKRKSLLLALFASLGGLAVILWPLLPARLRSPVGGVGQAHLVSIADAQQQVDYPLWAPREIPGGGQFAGVVVYRLKAPDLPGELARAKAEQHYRTGYGLEIQDVNGTVRVLGVPGSPAEQAGLARSVPLLAINGQSSARNSVAAAVTAARRARPPLILTYRGYDGAAHTVSLRPQRFLTHPAVPHVYTGRLATLDFRVRGRWLDLQEWPAGEGPTPPAPRARRVNIAGATVLLSDLETGPYASWTRGPTRFILDNAGGTLSQDEELRFIRSMYPVSQVQARR